MSAAKQSIRSTASTPDAVTYYEVRVVHHDGSLLTSSPLTKGRAQVVSDEFSFNSLNPPLNVFVKELRPSDAQAGLVKAAGIIAWAARQGSERRRLETLAEQAETEARAIR